MNSAVASRQSIESPFSLIVKGLKAKRSGASYIARCPAHEDSNPSLSISEKDGKPLVKCHSGCSQEAVVSRLKELGLWVTPVTLISTGPNIRYEYVDEHGTGLHATVRTPGKRFYQQHRAPNGQWLSGLGDRVVLFNLDKLTSNPTATVHFVEGEKDAKKLEGFGLLSTTAPMGAGKYRHEYSASIRGRDVVIFYDNDPAPFVGQEHAKKAALSMLDADCTVRIDF